MSLKFVHTQHSPSSSPFFIFPSSISFLVSFFLFLCIPFSFFWQRGAYLFARFFVTRPYVFHVLGAGTHPFRLCPISVKNRHTWKLQKVKVLTLGLFDRSTGFPNGFWAARPYVFFHFFGRWRSSQNALFVSRQMLRSIYTTSAPKQSISLWPAISLMRLLC